MSPIEQARAAVAARYVQPYQVNAILAGEWDAGSLIQEDLANIGPGPTPSQNEAHP